jgi:hypothetical protein
MDGFALLSLPVAISPAFYILPNHYFCWNDIEKNLNLEMSIIGMIIEVN